VVDDFSRECLACVVDTSAWPPRGRPSQPGATITTIAARIRASAR